MSSIISNGDGRGMISGGRVEQHIADNISNTYATILLIGYTAEGDRKSVV